MNRFYPLRLSIIAVVAVRGFATTARQIRPRCLGMVGMIPFVFAMPVLLPLREGLTLNRISLIPQMFEFGAMGN